MPLSVERALEIASKRREAFKMQSQRWDYPTQRGLDEYEDMLPCGFLSDIDRLNSEGNGAILDIGAGQGEFLSDIRSFFPNLKTAGISAYDYRNERGAPLDPEVDYRIGDIQNLRNIFPNHRFDVIVSVKTFIYLEDPLNAIRQAFSLLNTGGTIAIDNAKIKGSNLEIARLRTAWEDVGVYAQFSTRTTSGIDTPTHGFYLKKQSSVEKLPITSDVLKYYPYGQRLSEIGVAS